MLPWIVPIAAVIAAAVLAWQAWSQRGPLVWVEFERGEGIAAGDPVSYRGVRVGDVRAVTLSPDLKRIVVEARLRRDAAGLAVEGSRFWIVRPEISAGRVSGLETLLGPRYLECEPGDTGASSKAARRFVGIERGPGRAAGDGALEIVVIAPDRGSLMVDSPVTYRGIMVGAVREIALSPDARGVELRLAVEPAYRALVRNNTRFWNSGGIGVDWGLWRGLSVRAESLQTAVGGGIAFATPSKPGELVGDGARFVLESEPKKEWLDWAPAIDLGAK